ncbi:MAG: apiosidase-like domain-containing protein, partial [Gammaproteobacteria bacterium]
MAPVAAIRRRGYGANENCPNGTESVGVTGGDIRGDVVPDNWQQIGRTLKATSPAQLVTFHPRGRTQSSTWFHTYDWLDFNMFQSGHRRYDQIREEDDPDTWKGE